MLSRERHFHTAFCGDTGYGKSVAAERLAYETTLRWHYRTIVLDFGQGWRRALNWPGLEGRVDIRQLYPAAPRPLRWNILQVPKRIEAGRYRSLVAELLANAGRMGPRQLGFIRRALTELYRELGVLTADAQVWEDEEYGKVRHPEEAAAINRKRGDAGMAIIQPGVLLYTLSASDRQALAVHRSRHASIRQLVSKLEDYYRKIGRSDGASRTSLEGVLLRLEQFGDWHTPGEGDPIEDLGLAGPADDPWGMAVIEGGAEMDEYPKAALLSLLASVLYFDAIARRGPA